MTAKRKSLSVTFHPHALERLQQRFPGTKKEQIRRRLRHRINAVLRNGVPVIYGAIRVEVQPDVWCVCAPDLCGWIVITVIDRNIPREAEMGG